MEREVFKLFGRLFGHSFGRNGTLLHQPTLSNKETEHLITKDEIGESGQRALDTAYHELQQQRTKTHRSRKGRDINRHTGEKTRGLTKKDYQITNDGTALDNLVKLLLEGIDFPVNGISIGGISGEPAKEDHRCFREMLKKPPLNHPNPKRYFVRLRLSYHVKDKWGLHELFPEELWTEGYDHGKATELAIKASERIEASFHTILDRDNVRAGVSYSRGNEQYISLGVEVPVTAYDVLVHCPTTLTNYGQSNLREISEIVEELIERKGVNLLSLYHNRKALNGLCRDAEDLCREDNGIAKVGQGWVSQAKLFSLIKMRFPNAKIEYSPLWLGSQRIDIFIPSHKVAIEYHGLQHYEPVGYFGGEDSFKKTVARDKLKAELCRKNGVEYYEWPHTRPVIEEQVEAFIEEIAPRMKRNSSDPNCQSRP